MIAQRRRKPRRTEGCAATSVPEPGGFPSQGWRRCLLTQRSACVTRGVSSWLEGEKEEERPARERKERANRQQSPVLSLASPGSRLPLSADTQPSCRTSAAAGGTGVQYCSRRQSWESGRWEERGWGWIQGRAAQKGTRSQVTSTQAETGFLSDVLWKGPAAMGS